MHKLFESVALSLLYLQLLGCESAQNTERVFPAPALEAASEWLKSLQGDLYQDELVGTAVDEYT